MYISSDVVFHETMFPFATTSLTESYAAQPAPFIPSLHIPTQTPTPLTPPAASNITPSLTFSHSSSAEPSVTHSHSNTHAPPRTHPMHTRA
jgi:hypothetical protein